MPPTDFPAFANLPVEFVTSGDAGTQLAIHVAGELNDQRIPIICVPGYCRNMSDFSAFVEQFHRLGPADWPIVLVDLAGRGRSFERKNSSDYTTLNDAHDLASIAASLGIEAAIFLGQSHGGQVAMALSAGHAGLIAGTVLIDASPITDTPGLVRMRDNLNLMAKMRGRQDFLRIARQVYGHTYPGFSDAELDAIADRTHLVTKNGKISAIFDASLLKRLENIQFDDIFEAQWPLFNMLSCAPMMLMRTQLTDQLQRATFERMGALRSDAVQLVMPGQGSPAMLSGEDEVGAIVDFVLNVSDQAKLSGVVSG